MKITSMGGKSPVVPRWEEGGLNIQATSMLRAWFTSGDYWSSCRRVVLAGFGVMYRTVIVVRVKAGL